MKTINPKSLLLILLLLSGSILLANTAPVSNTVTGKTEKTIQDFFKFPQVLLPHYNNARLINNKVEVIFTTNNSGQVNFVLAKTNNPELKREIEKQFSSLHLSKIKQDVVH